MSRPDSQIFKGNSAIAVEFVVRQLLALPGQQSQRAPEEKKPAMLSPASFDPSR
jgi:hypothetical protein